jgi:hypothetical protein
MPVLISHLIDELSASVAVDAFRPFLGRQVDRGHAAGDAKAEQQQQSGCDYGPHSSLRDAKLGWTMPLDNRSPAPGRM